MPLFRQLRMVEEIATSARADFALILGSKIKAVRKRRDFYADKVHVRHHEVEVAFLASTRQLFPDELQDPACAGLATEAQMAQVVLAERSYPWEEKYLVRHPYVLLDLAGKTEGTARVWRDQRRPPGGSTVISVSGQPFAIEQSLSVQEALGSAYRVLAVGYEAPAELGPSTYLDTLAKAIDKIARSRGYQRPQ